MLDPFIFSFSTSSARSAILHVAFGCKRSSSRHSPTNTKETNTSTQEECTLCIRPVVNINIHTLFSLAFFESVKPNSCEPSSKNARRYTPSQVSSSPSHRRARQIKRSTAAFFTLFTYCWCSYKNISLQRETSFVVCKHIRVFPLSAVLFSSTTQEAGEKNAACFPI